MGDKTLCCFEDRLGIALLDPILVEAAWDFEGQPLAGQFDQTAGTEPKLDGLATNFLLELFERSVPDVREMHDGQWRCRRGGFCHQMVADAVLVVKISTALSTVVDNHRMLVKTYGYVLIFELFLTIRCAIGSLDRTRLIGVLKATTSLERRDGGRISRNTNTHPKKERVGRYYARSLKDAYIYQKQSIFARKMFLTGRPVYFLLISS